MVSCGFMLMLLYLTLLDIYVLFFQVEIQRVSGSFPQERIAICDSNSDCSDGSNNDDTMVVKVRFVQLSNINSIT